MESEYSECPVLTLYPILCDIQQMGISERLMLAGFVRFVPHFWEQALYPSDKSEISMGL